MSQTVPLVCPRLWYVLPALACVALGLLVGPARAEDVAYVSSGTDGRTVAKWTGEILDFSGRELRMRLANGREKAFPAARVVSIETPQSAQQQAGDTALAAQQFRRALDQYRAAMSAKIESRAWVRRQILAQIVWCQRDLGLWDSACDSFVSLVTDDAKTPYFDCIPLAWTPAEPAPALEAKARQWLKGDQPAATLLGASYLLSTSSRPAALEQLKRLSLDRDARIALLAQAQIWRTTAFNASGEQLNTWRHALEKFPDALRGGPDYVVGSGLLDKQPEVGVLLLLQLPVLYPRERQLAGAALLAAGGALDKLERGKEAAVLYGELTAAYADQPEAAEARRRLGEARAGAIPTEQEAGRESLDERYVAGLRRRGLFALGESWCGLRLADAELADVPRAELTIQWVRTLAEHAASLPPDQRATVWQEAAAAVDDFSRHHAQNSRLLLVRMQGALVALAAAELARQEAEIGSGRTDESVRASIRAAIAQLKQLETEVATQLRSRGRGSARVLSDAELTSLESNVRYQLARAFRNQALIYPPGSSDRINALVQANELLSPLAAAGDDDRLVWPSRLEQLVCLRLLGRLPDAAQKIADLQKLSPSAEQLRRLRAEGVRLLVAGGRLEQALKAAGEPVDESGPGAADLDFARLEALVASWQKAAADHNATAAAEFEQQATSEVRRIEALHGPYWMRRAETLLAGTLAKAAKAQNLESLTRAAVSYYRGGQIDEALKAYDEAAEQAAAKGLTDQAFDIGYTAAAIENQRKHFHDAAQRFEQLALAHPEHAKAAEAHLAAIYNEAEAARADARPLDEYRRLLEEHLKRWPKSPSLAQVGMWLGKLSEHERAWDRAATAYRAVPRESESYPDAVAAAADAYEKWFAAQRAAGKPEIEAARQAALWLEQVIAGAKNPEPAGARAEFGPLERQAALVAARIWLNEVPGSAPQAEDVLRNAIEHAQNPPVEWLASARSLQVTALAAQGRFDEARSALETISGGSPADVFAMLEGLARSSSQVEGDLKRQLADLELKTLDALAGRARELGAADRKRMDRIRAQALVDLGDRRRALDLCERLAREVPGDGQVQENLAGLLLDSRDPEELRRALAKYREVLDKSRPGTPRWFRAQLGLARGQLALGNRAQARAIIKLVEVSHPDLGGEDFKPKFAELLDQCERPNR